MNDSISRWDDSEILESSLTPFQERESLGVSCELKLLILVLGVRCRGDIDLNRVINDQVNLALRVDFGWVRAHLLDSSPHGGQVNYSWHSREILQDDSSWLERDLDR